MKLLPEDFKKSDIKFAYVIYCSYIYNEHLKHKDMKTISQKYGIGNIEKEYDTYYEVYWADYDKTTKVLKQFAKLYETEDEANNALDSLEDRVNERPTISSEQVHAMEEMREKALRNQRPSWMR